MIEFSTVQPDELADKYANDPRVIHVQPDKSGYTVRAAGGPGDSDVYHVLHTGMFGWTLCQGDDLHFVQLPDLGVTDAHFAIGVETAGEFLQALLGDPQSGGGS